MDLFQFIHGIVFFLIKFEIWHTEHQTSLFTLKIKLICLNREGFLCFEIFGIYTCDNIGKHSGICKTWDKIVSLLVYEASQRIYVRDQAEWVIVYNVCIQNLAIEPGSVYMSILYYY